MLGVLGVIPFWVGLPVSLLASLTLNRRVLRQVDYRLLFTFGFLFLAIDNLSAVPVLAETVSAVTTTPGGTYLTAALLSQGISNVPSAIFLAPFTSHVRALFLGVSVGGLGTLVASMANLIAYKLYVKAYPHGEKRFLVLFGGYNFLGLALLGSLFFLLL